MKRRDKIKSKIRLMHDNVGRMQKHLYDIWMILDEDMEREKAEIAVFVKMLNEVDEAVDKLRADIIG